MSVGWRGDEASNVQGSGRGRLGNAVGGGEGGEKDDAVNDGGRDEIKAALVVGSVRWAGEAVRGAQGAGP